MPVSIGLAGAGRRAAQVHAPALTSCQEVGFAGVWARSRDAADRLADAHGVPAYHRFDDLLGRCDAVAFALPPAAQADLAAVAARAHKAVLLEIPVAGDLAGAEHLAIAVRAAGVVSRLALAWRYAPAVRLFLADEVKRTWPKGGSGRLVLQAQPRSRWQLERLVLMDVGIQLADLLEAALGRVVDVRAHGDRQGWLGLMLEHEGGRFSEASMYLSESSKPAHGAVEVFGPGGTASVDPLAVTGPDAYTAIYDAFAEAVIRGSSGQKPGELDADHGLHLQQVAEAAQDDVLRTV